LLVFARFALRKKVVGVFVRFLLRFTVGILVAGRGICSPEIPGIDLITI
jgi:hypothetical protein